MHSLLKPAVFLVTLSAALSAFSQVQASNRITQAIDDRETRQLRGNLHPLLQHAADQGRMDGGVQLEGVSLVFKRTAAQEAAVEKLLADQQNPSSPSYHKWLTPEQYADRFGLSQADLDKVVAWLQAEGFTVNRVARGRTQVWFTGSVTQIEAAFRTEMHRYRVKGETHFANGVELAVPAALSRVVLGFHNLDDFRPRARVKSRTVPGNGLTAHFHGSDGNNYLAPDDFATIYNLQPLYSNGIDGNGQTLAVVGQSAISTSDLDAFRTAFGLPSRTSSNFQQVLVPNSGTSTIVTGDQDESSLDLEWSAGIAKGATQIFVYVGNNSNFNVFDSITYAVDNNVAPIISISYGNCEAVFTNANLTTFQQLAQQGNLQGQTIAAASGDFGPADCDTSDGLPAQGGIAIDVPGAIPEVTSVGGTTFSGDVSNPATYWNATSNANGGSAIKYIPETTWNDTLLIQRLRATGGGASTFFSKPTWQVAPGVPADGKRDVPDIALAASPEHDGYLFCSAGNCSGGFGVAGGTSFGSPTFTGIVALLNEATVSNGQGNINPTLYSLHGTHPGAFHDVTTGNNDVPCGAGTPNCPTSGTLQYGFSAGAGYDLVTGLGSLDADVLITSAPGYSASPDFVLSQNAPVTITTPGHPASSTIKITGINGFTGSVDLTCSMISGTAGIGCTISPSSVPVSSSPSTAAVTITTTAAHVVAGPGIALGRGSAPFWLAGSGTLLAGVFVLGIPARRRRWRVAGAMLVFALLAAAVGCSGGSSTPHSSGTPAGTYTATVTATPAGGGTAHTTTVSITVQ
ncbi:MAG: S53 family peptidase [Terriglobales bacterium]